MTRSLTKGLFISFEGIEGSGKSTQARLLAASLLAEGYSVVLTQEPGGTVIGERIRSLVLDPAHTEMCPATELLLYAAARAQHLAQKIRPALAGNAVVITDRFSDSTAAYQGYARGIDRSVLNAVDAVATSRLRPDITFLCDLPAETGLRRNRGVNKHDRLELEALSFHQKVREGFLELAAEEPNRFRIVDAGQPVEKVTEDIARIMAERLWALTK